MKKLALSLAVLALGTATVLQAEVNHAFAPVTPEDAAKITAAVPAQARVKPAKPHKVLVFFLTEGFVHNSIPYANEALKQIGEKTGAFEPVFSDDMAVFTSENLKQYDAIIFQNTTGLKFADPAQREALMGFLKSGKGLVGIHSATDNFPGWPEMQNMIGGVFDGHPWGGGDTVAVKLDEPNHPLNAAFDGKGFWIKEEIYQFKDGAYGRDKQRIIMSLDMSKPQNARPPEKLKRTDNDFGLAWVKKVDGGPRVFYTSIGHNPGIYAVPQILQFYLDGIQFALGDQDADAVPSSQLTAQPTPALAPDAPAILNAVDIKPAPMPKPAATTTPAPAPAPGTPAVKTP